MKPIEFELTGRQNKILKPLFETADNHLIDGNPGIVIAQCYREPHQARALFVPEKYAIRIIEIVKEYIEEEKQEEQNNHD